MGAGSGRIQTKGLGVELAGIDPLIQGCLAIAIGHMHADGVGVGIQADQQQINLTRFSLFFDEKRPFFQERAGIFGFDTGADRGTLFYSRRIGLSDTGQPIRELM